jgi:hypothetical protein
MEKPQMLIFHLRADQFENALTTKCERKRIGKEMHFLRIHPAGLNNIAELNEAGTTSLSLKIVDIAGPSSQLDQIIPNKITSGWGKYYVTHKTMENRVGDLCRCEVGVLVPLKAGPGEKGRCLPESNAISI